jgi:hypothetical protein
LSGGGIRSAAFSLGMLHGLHDLGILRNVDVVSAVSGGTYALSWLVLQPFYGNSATDEDLAAMFSDEGPYQSYLRTNSPFVEIAAVGGTALYDMTVGQVFRPLIRLVDASADMLTETRKLYGWRIQNTFHGHPGRTVDGKNPSVNTVTLSPSQQALPTSHWVVRNVEFPGELSDFLSKVRTEGRGVLPYPVFNVTLNARVHKKFKGQIWPHHFELTPLGLGGSALGYVDWDRLQGDQFKTIRSVNLAPAISGAAISGYAEAGSAWLRLVFRLLNVDLGYTVRNFYGPDPSSIYLSDGGHSENLGLYALIQRQCETAIAVDAEHEEHATGIVPKYEFESYDKLAKAIEKEKLAMITLEVGDPKTAFDGSQPVLKGNVDYPDGFKTEIIYVKLALDRKRLADLPAAVRDYATEVHPRFPHDPTTGQEYVPDQFKAYESLGRHVACNATALQHLASRRCTAASPELRPAPM